MKKALSISLLLCIATFAFGIETPNDYEGKDGKPGTPIGEDLRIKRPHQELTFPHLAKAERILIGRYKGSAEAITSNQEKIETLVSFLSLTLDKRQHDILNESGETGQFIFRLRNNRQAIIHIHHSKNIWCFTGGPWRKTKKGLPLHILKILEEDRIK